MNDQYPHDTSEPDRDHDHVDPTVATTASSVSDDDRAPASPDADSAAPSAGQPAATSPAPHASSAHDDAHASSVHDPAHVEAVPPARGDAPPYGVGPFSVREVALLGVWVVAFFVSFFRTNILDSPSGVLIGGANVWLSGLWWIPAVALPTVAVGLVVLRRLSPQGIRRVGSLGIDQFASVAFTVSALVWVSWVWDTVAVFDQTGIWTRSWVIWVEAVVLLAGVVLTVFAPLIPPFSADFRGREEIPAHRNARPIRPVVPRPRVPRAPRPEAATAESRSEADTLAPGSFTGSTDLPHDDAAPATSVLPTPRHDDTATDIFAPLHADTGAVSAHDAARETSRDAADDARNAPEGGEHPHTQAFWALAPEEREIVDDYGTPIFRIGPTAWALVIEDRGETFVVRHDDGRIGYLHDVSGVTRG